MQVLIKGGKGVEPQGKNGLSYLTTRLALETPEQGKSMDLMSLATRISIAGHGEYTMVNIACLLENFSYTLEIVSKIMLKPQFSGLMINGIKKIIDQMREIENDEPLNIAAMSEAMVLGNKAGVNPENVFQAIRGGLAGSTVLDAKMPLVLKGNFKPGFRIKLHIKDLMNALDTAH